MRSRHIMVAGAALLALAALAYAWWLTANRHRAVADTPSSAAENLREAEKPQPDWPIFRGDPALRGVASELPDQLELLWTFTTGGGVKSSAVIGGGRVFVGSDDTNVYALDLASGEQLWVFATGDAVEAPPLLHGGSVYVGSLDGHLYALSAADGGLVWSYAAGDKITGGANVIAQSDGSTSVVVGSYDNRVHAVDAATGAARWVYETDNYINGTPAVAAGRVIVGGCDGRLHVIAADSGARLAAIDLGAYIAAAPAVEFPSAYVGHYGNDFVAVDLLESRVAWTFRERNVPYFSSPALTADRVLVGGRDRRLHCLRRSDGHELWSYRTGGQVDSSPVICGPRVVFGSADGRLYLVNLNDGSPAWSYDLGEDIIASPAVAGGKIVIGCTDGKVYAFGAEPEDR